MKPYLLIAGYNYYPQSGTNDWIATFNTLEEAENVVNIYDGDNENQEKIIINDKTYDWYEIIDLKTWIFRES